MRFIAFLLSNISTRSGLPVYRFSTILDSSSLAAIHTTWVSYKHSPSPSYPRADGVHTNALRGDLARETPCQLNHTALSYLVARQSKVLRSVRFVNIRGLGTSNRRGTHETDHACNACDHDDAPSVVESLHLLSSSLGREEHTLQVHVQNL